VIAASQHIRRIELRRRTLHLIRDQNPEVALNLRHRLHELLRLLRRLQLPMGVYLDLLTYIGLELLGIVIVLDALLAGLAERARTLGFGVLVRIAQVLVVLGVEAHLTYRRGGARRVADEAAVDCGVDEVGGVASLAAFFVEVVGDVSPGHLLIFAERLDELVLWVVFDVVVAACSLPGRLQQCNIVLDRGLDGAGTLESVHAGDLAQDVLGAVELGRAFDYEYFFVFGNE
jgi:hypothetical protein